MCIQFHSPAADWPLFLAQNCVAGVHVLFCFSFVVAVHLHVTSPFRLHISLCPSSLWRRWVLAHDSWKLFRWNYSFLLISFSSPQFALGRLTGINGLLLVVCVYVGDTLTRHTVHIKLNCRRTTKYFFVVVHGALCIDRTTRTHSIFMRFFVSLRITLARSYSLQIMLRRRSAIEWIMICIDSSTHTTRSTIMQKAEEIYKWPVSPVSLCANSFTLVPEWDPPHLVEFNFSNERCMHVETTIRVCVSREMLLENCCLFYRWRGGGWSYCWIIQHFHRTALLYDDKR